MKQYIYILFIAMITFSCTEEIFIDELNNVTPRLVIDANLEIDKSNSSRVQTIKLSQTAGFYSNEFPEILGATISVNNENGNSMGDFLDINPGIDEFEDGVYTSNNFSRPNIGDTYYLTITIGDETYIAQDIYTSITQINKIDQKTIVFPQETIQLNINIENEKDVDNFYLTKIETPFRIIPEYDVLDDELYDDSAETNRIDIPYIDDELEEGMNIEVTLFGVSKDYNNYLNKIIALSQGGNGPFSTAPASVRGNLLNIVDQDNYALGYFSINQFVKKNYLIEDPNKEDIENED